MTENKRFRLIDYEEDEFTVGDDLKGEELDNPFKIVECLNNLHKENQRLRKELDKLKVVNEMLSMDFTQSEHELLKENEQLKQQCKDFIEMLDDMSVAYLINDGLEEILNE